MFQCHQKANLACCHMPKLYLWWHKSVWFLLTSAISFFFFFLLYGSGGWELFGFGFSSQTSAGRSSAGNWFEFRDKAGLVACILTLFANRSRPQSADATLVPQIHQHLRLLSTRPSTFCLFWLKIHNFTICNNMHFISFSLHIWSPLLYIHPLFSDHLSFYSFVQNEA